MPPVGARRAGPAGPLLHRDKELALLDDILGGLAEGRPALVVIDGPRGIGKTALLQAATSRGPKHAVVLHARCYENEREFPFGVVRQLFDPLMSEPESDHADTHGTLNGFLRMTRSLATSKPVIIAIDDVTWADEQSRQWCSYISRRLDGLPVAILLTADADDTDPFLGELGALSNLHVLRPEPLCDTCAAEFVAAEFDAPLDSELAAACHTLSLGNPLVLDDLVRRLIARSVAPGAPDLDAVVEAGAETLADTTLEWLHRRVPIAVELLTNLAILGPGSDLETAAILAGHGEFVADDARLALRRAGLLAPASPDRFAHELVRAAILNRIDAAQRLDLHERAAALLARLGAPAGQVAEHLMSVGTSGQSWAVPILRAAAHEATAAGSWDTAARYLRRALAESSDADAVSALTAELGAVEMHRDLPASARYANSVATSDTSLLDRAGALFPFANPVLAVNSATAATPFVDVAAALSATADVPREVLLRFSTQALLTGHRAGVRRAVRVLRSGDDDAAARGFLGALAAVTAARGQYRGRVIRLATRSAAEGLPSAIDTSSALVGAALAMSWAERLDEATSWSSWAVEAAREQHHPAERALALVLRSDVAYRAGRLTSCLTDAAEARRLAEQTGASALQSAAAAVAARALVDRDEADGAAELLAKSDAPPAMHPLLRGIVLDAQGTVALSQRNPAEALRLFLECGHHLAARGIANPATVAWRTHAVRAYLAMDEVAAARTIAAEDVAYARRWGAPGALGRALAAAGSTQDGAERSETIAEAVRLLDASPLALDTARALAELAAAYAEAGDRAAAREAAQRGLDLARRCGAAALVRRLQAHPGTPAGLPSATAVRLTAGERRVIELVCQGMSNLDVADALCLSKRTVDTHLGRVYRKLGIRGRPELAAALRALDGAPGAG